MIRLLMDGTPIAPDAKGVGRYAFHLCLQLAERLPSDWELQVLVRPASNRLFPNGFRAVLVPVEPASEIVNALYVIPHQARKLGSSLLLKTNESAGYVRGIPTVTVCHDIDQLITIAQAEKRNPVRVALEFCKGHLRRRALQNSDFVICNSEFTRKAVEEYYHIPPDRTALGYCAVDPRFYESSGLIDKDAVRKKYGVARFVLTFATGDARENFRCYPAIAARMMALGVHTCLLIAGLKRDQPYALALRDQLVAQGLVEGKQFVLEDFLGGERFGDLASLYAAADFYLDPSLHEGFGMQLIEAMACGTTCISSSRGALAEVGDKYVLFVDPTNVEDMAQTIKRAYDNGLQHRDNREQVSYTRKFSWDSAGKAVTEALLGVAAKLPIG